MSGALNQYGFTPSAYGDQPNALAGTPGLNLLARAYANPLLNQVSTWTWTLSDTVGDVSVTILLPDGTELTATGTDAGSTDTTHADTIVLAINTDDAWKNVATASNVAGVVTVNFIHTGLDYTFLGFTAPGAGTLTPTVPDTQVAGGSPFPVARWVVAATNPVDADIPALALPSAVAASALIGVTTRPHGQLTNSVSTTEDEAFIASDMVPVGFDGVVQVVNSGTADAAVNGPVYVVINTAGGQALGLSRSDADGGNTVQPTLHTAYWAQPVKAGQRGLIRVRR